MQCIGSCLNHAQEQAVLSKIQARIHSVWLIHLPARLLNLLLLLFAVRYFCLYALFLIIKHYQSCFLNIFIWFLPTALALPYKYNCRK